MASLNKVLLIGNLGKDPELKYTPAGVAVCNFSVATAEKWTDKDGNTQERTEWHNIEVWRRNAEVAAEYLKKGRQVFIEGKLRTRSWEQEGQKRYAIDIVADRFLMLGTKPEGVGPAAPVSKPAAAAPARPGGAPVPEETLPPDDFAAEGDIPF